MAGYAFHVARNRAVAAVMIKPHFIYFKYLPAVIDELIVLFRTIGVSRLLLNI
jgi:hypothetical protein